MGCTRNAPGGLAGLDGGSGWESLARAPRVVSSGQQRALLHPAQREPQTRARPTRPCAVRAPRGELGVWHRNAPLALETESVPPRAPVSVTKLLGSPGGARPQNWTARPQRRAQGTQEESEDGSTGSPRWVWHARSHLRSSWRMRALVSSHFVTHCTSAPWRRC